MISNKTEKRSGYIKAGSQGVFILAMSLSVILFPLLSVAATTPNIRVNPMSVNLGSVKAGGASSPRTLTIKNTGKSDLAINAITISGTNASEFSYSPANGCPDPIPAKSSCQVEVTFNPAFPFEKKSAIMSISSNDPKKPAIRINLSGQSPPPKISAAPKSVNFATVNIGNTSSLKTVTVKNTGLSDLSISSISVTGSNPQDFSQTNNCSVIARGSSCAINIAFIPSQPGSGESASLIISSDDPKKPDLSVKLKGRGGEGGASPSVTDSNVMLITVNGSLCSNNFDFSYINKPCVSVTVCTPGTTDCQTIDDILLDTGSSGLRIFQQALNVPLVSEASGDSGFLAECIQYADGSSDWGPIQIAGVILGDEPAVEVPIQVIDPTFGTPPVACRNTDQGPADAGFNGILGVGLFVEDCGQRCLSISSNGMYYVCNGPDCQGTAVPLSSQVRNPVALLPQDNNGVIVELPDVPLGGLPSVDGYLVLGIGTRANNLPSAVKTYPADEVGEFITKFNGNTYHSFLDTGSNGLFFPPPSANVLPICSGWFCPASTKSFSATNTGSTGSPSGTVSFSIGNFNSLTSSSNNVFSEIGGNEFSGFDWGLPFHFGRNVYIGLEGTVSSLGSGTYWAY